MSSTRKKGLWHSNDDDGAGDADGQISKKDW
jgi:hypothetical protein